MSFRLANPQGIHVPRVIQKALAASQTFNNGALLVVDSNDNWAECGADPAAVAAVALSAAGADTSGFNILGKFDFPPGFMDGMTLRGTQYTAKYVGTLPAANGGLYGVVRDTDNDWKVDFTEITATVVKLVGRRTDSPENLPLVVVEFLPDIIQDF